MEKKPKKYNICNINSYLIFFIIFVYFTKTNISITISLLTRYKGLHASWWKLADLPATHCLPINLSVGWDVKVPCAKDNNPMGMQKCSKKSRLERATRETNILQNWSLL